MSNPPMSLVTVPQKTSFLQRLKTLFFGSRNEPGIDVYLNPQFENVQKMLEELAENISELAANQTEKMETQSLQLESQGQAIRNFRKSAIALEDANTRLLEIDVKLNDNISKLGIETSVLELAQQLRSYLLSTFTKDVIEKIKSQDLSFLSDLDRALNVLDAQMISINAVLERHNLSLVESVFAPFDPTLHQCEIVEECDEKVFQEILKLLERRLGLDLLNSRMDGIACQELQAGLLVFLPQNGEWKLKKLSRVVVLRPHTGGRNL